MAHGDVRGSRHRCRERAGPLPRPASIEGRSTGCRAVDVTIIRANEGGRAKWSNHSVVFRDDGESYNHYTNGNWGGVVSKVRADMELNAR